MSQARRVLFVCIHNSGRSRMIEAFLNEPGGPGFEAKRGERASGWGQGEEWLEIATSKPGQALPGWRRAAG